MVPVQGEGSRVPQSYFTPIRLCLAFFVAFEHVFYFQAGEANSPFELGHTSLGYFAVNGFFILSGYLITGSAERSANVLVFARSRLLRIMPALIFIALLLGLVVVPLLSKPDLASYYSDGALWSAIAKLSTFIDPYPQWPTLLMEGNPFELDRDMTGPIWTLRFEVLAYLGTAGLLLVGLHRNIPIILLGAAATTLLFVFDLQTHRLTELNGTLASLVRFGSCYLYGAAAYLLADRARIKSLFALPVLLIGAVLIALGIASGEVLMNLALTPILFAIAFSSVKAPEWVSKPPDFSYGLYIFHWPIYQVLTETVSRPPNGTLLFLVGLPLAIIAAIASWYLLEKPMLKLKAAAAYRPD
ncbi:MAG: acyltransferase [Hyphomonadaceae bacterium]